MFWAIVSMRVRWACKPLAPMSSTSNIASPRHVLSDPFLERRFQRHELLAEQFDRHVVQQRVLRLVGHQVFHRAVVAVVKQDAVIRILDLRPDVVERRRAQRIFPPVVDAVAEHRLERFDRQILLPVAGRVDVDDVLGDQPVPRAGEVHHPLQERRVALVEQSLDEHASNVPCQTPCRERFAENPRRIASPARPQTRNDCASRAIHAPIISIGSPSSFHRFSFIPSVRTPIPRAVAVLMRWPLNCSSVLRMTCFSMSASGLPASVSAALSPLALPRILSHGSIVPAWITPGAVSSTVARSMMFWSSRTLPGQGYFCMTRIASGSMWRNAFCSRRATWCRKWRHSSGMSSTRSRSGGRSIGTTFNRSNKSCRNFPSSTAVSRSRLL